MNINSVFTLPFLLGTAAIKEAQNQQICVAEGMVPDFLRETTSDYSDSNYGKEIGFDYQTAIIYTGLIISALSIIQGLVFKLCISPKLQAQQENEDQRLDAVDQKYKQLQNELGELDFNYSSLLDGLNEIKRPSSAIKCQKFIRGYLARRQNVPRTG